MGQAGFKHLFLVFILWTHQRNGGDGDDVRSAVCVCGPELIMGGVIRLSCRAGAAGRQKTNYCSRQEEDGGKSRVGREREGAIYIHIHIHDIEISGFRIIKLTMTS